MSLFNLPKGVALAASFSSGSGKEPVHGEALAVHIGVAAGRVLYSDRGQGGLADSGFTVTGSLEDARPVILERLIAAMRHGTLNGGKRLRPHLVGAGRPDRLRARGRCRRLPRT